MDALVILAISSIGAFLALAMGYRLGWQAARESYQAEIRHLKAERAALIAEASTKSAELSAIRRARMQLRYGA